MDKILNTLNEPLIGVLIGLIGISFGLYQIFRRTGPRLALQYYGQKLIEGESAILPRNVKVQYNDSIVPRLALTQFVIWNPGKAPIRGEDVVKDDPITFTFDCDAEILKAEVIKITRKSNKSDVIINRDKPGVCKYTFDFLNQQDGALIKILHTGKSTIPKCSGTIIGLPKGLEYWGRIPSNRIKILHYHTKFTDEIIEQRLNKIFASFYRSGALKYYMGVMAFLMIFVAINPSVSFLPNSDQEFPILITITFYVIGLFFGLATLGFYFEERLKFPAELLPDELHL